MYVLNITTKVNHAIAEEWKNWMLLEHIPEMLSTKLFTSNNFYILLDQENDEGLTYVSQYFFDDINNYNSYVKDISKAFTEKSILKWSNGFISFKTIMQSVQ